MTEPERSEHVAMRFTLALSLTLLMAPVALHGQGGLEVRFEDTEEFEFGESDKRRITEIIAKSERGVRAVMPALPDDIRVTVVPVQRDLGTVGGVAGRADAPGEVLIEISTTFPGGLPAAKPGLSRAVFHEFHHLVRGWTIRKNRFGPGIAIAAVNEGLADVFAEHYTGVAFEANAYPENVEEWAIEIMGLPPDADYAEWMFEHPDGRLAIGYRTGRYIVHQAMANSGKSILELSELSPDRILDLAEIERT